MRRADWPERLEAVLDRYAAGGFLRGRRDCLTLCLDVVHALTGERLFPGQRGYRSRAEAVRRGKALGFDTLGDACASVLREVHPVDAHRGDIVIIMDGEEEAGAVCTGADLVSMGAAGMWRLPRSQAIRAFRVG